MKKKRLIINADGFGFTYGNNKAIFEVLESGLIKSISVNVNFPAIEEVASVAQRFRDVGIGIHLNLSVGKPVCEPHRIPSLLNAEGEFWGDEFTRKIIQKKLDLGHMQKELHAQFEHLEHYGIKISHWDSHQDRHLYPLFMKAALAVAPCHNIYRMRNHYRRLFADQSRSWRKVAKFYLTNPRRLATYYVAMSLMKKAKSKQMKMAEHFLCPGAYGKGRDNKTTWINMFKYLPAGTSEVTCHPGYPDDTLKKYATMIDNRVAEADALRCPELRHAAQQYGVQIINFREL